MQFNKFDLIFKSLSAETLELVRQWRNADHVRLHMQFQEIITEFQQKEWLRLLDIATNIYLVIFKNSTPIGLVNLKNIDWELRNAEAGIFIGDVDYLNSIIPVMATIALLDFAFDTLNLKLINAKMELKNEKAVLFNLKLGYVPTVKNSEGDFVNYSLSPDNYYSATKIIRNTLNKMNHEPMRLEISSEEKRLFRLY